MSRVCRDTLILAVWCAAGLSDAMGQGLPSSVRACKAEQDSAHRLSCYDREIARLDQQASAEPAPPAVSAAADVVPEDKFGYRGTIARQELDRKKAESQIDEISATITEISRRPHGEFVVTLDNGQVWAQKIPEKSTRLQVGDQVKIKPGALGSFLLYSSGRSFRVTRLQ